MENPFFHRGPIRDREYFFDRSDELQRAVSLLKNKQSISVVGPRRIGKTSFLFRLAQLIREEVTASDLPVFAVYIDCSSLRLTSECDFYAVLLEEMALAVGVKEAVSAFGNQDTTAASVSFREFERVIRNLSQQKSRLIFLLDEFSTLSDNAQLGIDVFLCLRSLAMRFGVSYVTASALPLLELTYVQHDQQSSPFFNFFAQIRLGIFKTREAEHAIEVLLQHTGETFDGNQIRQILDMSGPHPLMLQIAGYHLVEWCRSVDGSMPETLAESVRHCFWDDAVPHWRYFWKNLSLDDQRLLALLPVSWRGNPDGVKRLIQTGLVIQLPDDVLPISAAFRAFVARQQVEGLLQAHPITIDPSQHVALLRGKLLSLSPVEFKLLCCLVERCGQIVPHDALETYVWGNTHGDPDRLRTTLRSLRHALSQDSLCIENVRGIGYRFVCLPD